MTVIDDFMPSGWRRDELCLDQYWEHAMSFYWKDCAAEPNNIFEELCDTVWKKVFTAQTPVETSGWEYWSHSMTVGDQLDWHLDTDSSGHKTPDEELKAFADNKLQTALHGFIYYCHRELPEGGYLEIKRGDEVERIQPVPNRLIIFDPSAQHRVTQVTRGVRRSFVSNLWKDRPRHIR